VQAEGKKGRKKKTSCRFGGFLTFRILPEYPWVAGKSPDSKYKDLSLL
jgi:hypothetical protein